MYFYLYGCKKMALIYIIGLWFMLCFIKGLNSDQIIVYEHENDDEDFEDLGKEDPYWKMYSML